MNVQQTNEIRELTTDETNIVSGGSNFTFNFCGYEIEYIQAGGACGAVGFVGDSTSSYRLVGC
jgi:hypothetical protein